jgi:xanthine dehydrogenase/oxidase
MQMDIYHDMSNMGGRNPFECDYSVGYDPSTGLIDAVICDSYADGGAVTDLTYGVMQEYNAELDGCYAFPNVTFNVTGCRTNKPPNTACRSFGHIQAACTTETIIAHVAFACGMTCEQIREVNMYTTRNAVTPYNQPIAHFTLPTIWSQLAASSAFASRQAQTVAFNKANRWRKRGMAMCTHTLMHCTHTLY